MDSYIRELEAIFVAMREHVHLVLFWLMIIWAINIINWVFLRGWLNILGNYPRSWHGLIGIPCSPFLHGNYNHLFFNSIPLFVLANFVLLGGPRLFYIVTVIIVILSGFGVWLFGRKALHIGASSLIMGYFGFLLMNAYHQGSIMAILIGFLCLYYFGSLLMSIFPAEADVSWEGHVSGLLSGVAATYLFPIVNGYLILHSYA